MTPIVLDTSVIFKWSRQTDEEPFVPQALHLLDQHLRREAQIHVPSLMFYELGNTIKQKRRLLPEDGENILLNIFTFGLAVYDIDPISAVQTYKMAAAYDLTFYDAAFVTLADEKNCPLITADQKLCKKLRSLRFVRFLGEFDIPARS